MPSLTSCYFCGDAVGASLDEYDLPEGAAPDDQVTVTLCAGCKGKLTTLFEEIDPARDAADSPDDEPSTADPAVDAEPDVSVEPAIDEDPDLDPVAGEQEPIFADDGDAVLDEELPDEDEPERPFATAEDDDAGSSEASSAPASEADVDSPSSGESEGVADETGSAGPEPDGEESDGSAPAAGPESADTEDADSAPDTGDRSDDADPEARTVEVNVGGTASTSSGATSESSGSSPDGPLADVSPRTYNRVVRLLQNREFPVDRADFEALATSAYELDHGECAAALDGAIEKGLLEERGGELHRPE